MKSGISADQCDTELFAFMFLLHTIDQTASSMQTKFGFDIKL